MCIVQCTIIYVVLNEHRSDNDFFFIQHVYELKKQQSHYDTYAAWSNLFMNSIQ